MPIRLQCPLGHTWEFAHDGQTTIPLGAGSCPLCGRTSDRISLASRSVAAGATTHDTSPYTEPIAVGRGLTVPGYELLGKLGHGGMGVVYKARQLSLNRVVALKMPRFGAPVSIDQLQRFRAEAEAIAGFRHPNILPVHDFGEHAGQPYFSMEYAEGGSLEDYVAGSIMPARPAADLVATLARAVHAAHQAGLVHRDLKPANILLTADGVPKISDFGLAMTVEALSGQGASAIEGTPSYMAPEQAAGGTEPIGRLADVYALGAILYRLLTGQAPFQGDDVVETLEQVRRQPAIPPRRHQPEIPRDLEAICLKCLAKSPDRRYAGAAELADDLDRFLKGETVRARATPPWEWAARLVRRRPAWIALGLILLTLGCGAVWYWYAFRRVSVEYFANTISRWGVPEGIGRLTAEQVRHRGKSYRIVSRAGRVERMESVNALGRLVDRPGLAGPIVAQDDLTLAGRHVCAFDYRRDESGRLTDEIARNAVGEVVWSFHYTEAETGHFKDPEGLPFPAVNSGAAFVRFVRSADGLDLELRYLDAAGQPKPDARGVYGSVNEFDHRGLLTRMTTLGQDGQAAPSAFGPPMTLIRYDDLGNPIELKYCDSDGRLGLTPQSFCRAENEYDRWGNLTRTTYFGTDGRRRLRTDGYAEFVMEMNDLGECMVAECHGTDGKPIVCPDGYARLHIRRDEVSHPVEIRFCDAFDRPTEFREGYSILRSKFDAGGHTTETEFFDKDDAPCRCKNGYARLQNIFLEGGRLVESHTFGPDGRPCADESGVPTWTVRFDARGQERERRFFVTDGVPTNNVEGYAGWRTKHDQNGRVIEVVFFDLQGRPCQSTSGVARWSAQFDEAGEMKLTYHDLAGRELRGIVKVVRVDVGNKADALGIRADDVLLNYAGQDVKTAAQMRELRRQEPPGSPPRELIVLRNGERLKYVLPTGAIGLYWGNFWIPK